MAAYTEPLAQYGLGYNKLLKTGAIMMEGITSINRDGVPEVRLPELRHEISFVLYLLKDISGGHNLRMRTRFRNLLPRNLVYKKGQPVQLKPGVSGDDREGSRLSFNQLVLIGKLTKFRISQLTERQLNYLLRNDDHIKNIIDNQLPSRDLLSGMNDGSITKINSLEIDLKNRQPDLTGVLIDLLDATENTPIKRLQFGFRYWQYLRSTMKINEDDRSDLIKSVQKTKIEHLEIYIGDQIIEPVLEGVRTNSHIRILRLGVSPTRYIAEPNDPELRRELKRRLIANSDTEFNIARMIPLEFVEHRGDEFECQIEVSQELQDYLITFLPGILEENYTLQRLDIGVGECTLFDPEGPLEQIKVEELLKVKNFPSLKDRLVKMIRESELLEESSVLPPTISRDISYSRK